MHFSLSMFESVIIAVLVTCISSSHFFIIIIIHKGNLNKSHWLLPSLFIALKFSALKFASSLVTLS